MAINHDYTTDLCGSQVQMTLRLVCVLAVFQTLSPQVAMAQGRSNDLVFGQVYGSAGFLASRPSGTMTDAPATILVFASEDGHRNLVLTDKAGDSAKDDGSRRSIAV